MNLLHLHKLIDAVKQDPEMVHIYPSHSNPWDNTITVCIYRMRLCLIFFSGIGKASFFRLYLRNLLFSNSSVGYLSNMPATIYDLVGCAYFKKQMLFRAPPLRLSYTHLQQMIKKMSIINGLHTFNKQSGIGSCLKMIRYLQLEH